MNEAMTLLVVVPLAAALLATVWPRHGAAIGLSAVSLVVGCAAWLFNGLLHGGAGQQVLGGWQAGLGIGLRADGVAILLTALTALVALAVSVYATRYFRDSRSKAAFWPLWLMLLTALNALFLAGDLFNLYVTLELLGLSAVALTTIGGKRAAIDAALRYLMIGLLGSMGYLAGVAILYTAFGTLDMRQMAPHIGVDPASEAALLLMTAGLLLKTALFPLHFWLPAAHASAPAPVSAALSALVVKAGFYLVLRLWTDVFPNALSAQGAVLIGVLGAGGILWGSWQALRAERLKLMAAYSTVAQLGYLFIGIALLIATPPGVQRELLFGALLLMALTHGFAKSSLFLACGIVQQQAGHDRITDLGGTAQRLPATTFAIALAGVALIGLPPSGAFLGKWLLLDNALTLGHWPWIVVVAIGSLLAAGYVFRVLGHAFGPEHHPARAVNVASLEWPAMLLGVAATLMLGIGSAWLWPFIGAAA